jgi:hypothetical protein
MKMEKHRRAEIRAADRFVHQFTGDAKPLPGRGGSTVVAQSVAMAANVALLQSRQHKQR